MPLTETDIKALRADPERHRWICEATHGLDGKARAKAGASSDGLYLRIPPGQGRVERAAWVWRNKSGGKTTWTKIEDWPLMTVKAARAAVAKRAGRAAAPSAETVRDGIEAWFADQIEGKYRRTNNARVYADWAIAAFGGMKLQEVEHNMRAITVKLRAYGKRAPVAANRCLSTMRLAFGWFVEMHYIDRNPFAELTTRIAGGDEDSRARVLGDDELRELWRLESPNANLLRALLLTGCRIAELQKASTAHLMRGAAELKEFRPDPEGDWLFIPAAHSKNGYAHHVYLVPEVREQFNGRSPLLFRAVSPTAVQAYVRRLQVNVDDDAPREPWASIRPIDKQTGEPMGPWTPHDLRRTFATRLGERPISVAPHVISKCLNHALEGMAAIYQRAELLEERIAATKLWAAKLGEIVFA